MAGQIILNVRNLSEHLGKGLKQSKTLLKYVKYLLIIEYSPCQLVFLAVTSLCALDARRNTLLSSHLIAADSREGKIWSDLILERE